MGAGYLCFIFVVKNNTHPNELPSVTSFPVLHIFHHNVSE